MSLPSIQQGGSSFREDSSRLLSDFENRLGQAGSPKDLDKLKADLVNAFDIYEKQKIAIESFHFPAPEKPKTVNTNRSTTSGQSKVTKPATELTPKKIKTSPRIDKKDLVAMNDRIREIKTQNTIVSLLGLPGELLPEQELIPENQKSMTARIETEKQTIAQQASAREYFPETYRSHVKSPSDTFNKNFIIKSKTHEKAIQSPARTFTAIQLNMRSLQNEYPSPTRSVNIYRMKNSFDKVEKFKAMSSHRSMASFTSTNFKSFDLTNTNNAPPIANDKPAPDSVKYKLINIVSQDIDAVNDPLPIYPPTEKMIECLREENLRPLTASSRVTNASQGVSIASPRTTMNSKKKENKKYGMKKPPPTHQEKGMLTNFIQNQFVNELIMDKYHRRVEENKMSSFEEIRKLILENRMIKLRQQVDVDSYHREMADKELRQKTYEKYRHGDAMPPKDFTRNTIFEVFTPDVSFELNTGVRSKYKTNEGDTSRRRGFVKTMSRVQESFKDSNLVRSLQRLQSIGEDAQKIDEMAGKVLAEHIMKNRYKRVRLNLAATLKKWSLLKLSLGEIIERKIFPTQPFEKDGSYEFLKAAKIGDIKKIIRLLKKYRFYVFAFDQLKQTALHWAAKRGHWEICSLLIEFGADVDIEEISGKTALFFALKNGRDEAARILFMNKADPWSRRTHLDYRSNCGNFYCTKALGLARQLSIILTFHNSRDRNLIWKLKVKEIFDGDNLMKKGNLLADDRFEIDKSEILAQK